MSRNVTELLSTRSSVTVAEYRPAGIPLDGRVQPGDDVCRFQVMGSVAGTPRCRSTTSEPEPRGQSAEPQTRADPNRMTRATYRAPTLNVQVGEPVLTTSTLNWGSRGLA